MSKQVFMDKVVGTAKDGVWSQVVNRVNESGWWVGLVSLRYVGESDVLDVAEIGSEILEELKNFLDREDVGQEKLIKKMQVILSELDKDLVLSSLVMQANQDKLVIVGVGEMEVWMLRKGELGRIFERTDKVKGVVGKLEVGDVVMGMSKFLRQLVTDRELIEKMKRREVRDELVVRTHSLEDSSKVVGVYVDVVGEKEKKIGKFKFRLSFKPRSIKVRREQAKNNLRIGGALMVVVCVLVVVGALRRGQLIKEANYISLQNSVVNKLEQARVSAELNPERAKDFLSQAKEEVEVYLDKVKEEKYKVKAEQLQREIQQTDSQVFKREQVELKTLVELSVLGIDFSEVMELDNEKSLILLDKEKHKLVGFNSEDKSHWEVVLKNNQLEGQLGVYDGRAYLITNKGVESIELGDDESEGKLEGEVEVDDLWGQISLIKLFGGNIYLLDKGEGEIWKYPRLSDGFGRRKRWLGTGINLDLSKVVDMEIDGDIWIVTESGKLERYSRGVPIEFLMTGFPFIEEKDRLINPKAIAIDDDKIYVLEAGAKRIVVFNRESGKYEKQLINEELKDGLALVVVDGKGYVLLRDKIVEMVEVQ